MLLSGDEEEIEEVHHVSKWKWYRGGSSGLENMLEEKNLGQKLRGEDPPRRSPESNHGSTLLSLAVAVGSGLPKLFLQVV